MTQQNDDSYIPLYERRSYPVAILIAFDQLVNAMLWGYPDETLSSRAYRMAPKKKRWMLAEKFINLLFFWEPDHCYLSYMAEFHREHLSKEFRLNENND